MTADRSLTLDRSSDGRWMIRTAGGGAYILTVDALDPRLTEAAALTLLRALNPDRLIMGADGAPTFE